jgi:hypothetical protein
MKETLITKFFNSLTEEEKLDLFINCITLLEETEYIHIPTSSDNLEDFYWSHSGDPLV